MVTSSIRRLSRGTHPFSADREHLHHKLMDAGYGTWKILIALYLASIILGLSAIGWYLLPLNIDMLIILLVWIAGSLMLLRLTRHVRPGTDPAC
jgi:hypothetical protein